VILGIQAGFRYYRKYREREQQAMRLEVDASELRAQTADARLSSLKMQLQLQATMNTLEAALDPKMFLRIHRSLIVNIDRIAQIQPAGHGEYVVVLRNGMRLQSGRSYHEKLKALASNPF
jgi:two-component system LytT family response regulator